MKNNKNYFKILIAFFVIFLFINSCKKEELESEVNFDEITNTEKPELVRINKFIYNGLKDYYLWTDNVNYFKDENKNDKLSLMSLFAESDHNKFFDKLLDKNNDKWSWIVDDYTKLESDLMGEANSMGFEFGLLRLSENNDDLIGYVQYIFKNSQAEKAGLKRGDMFTIVNGTKLTAQNYKTVLTTNVYKLDLVKVSGNGNVYLLGKSIAVYASDLNDSPIFLDTIYTYTNNKIGYLVYNGFKPNYDIELNKVFAKFKSKNINHLILDLRYNSGGSVQTAIYLASMIFSTDTSLVFAKAAYNKKLQEYIVASEGQKSLTDYFTNKIKKTQYNEEAKIESLHLNNLTVLTSYATASASELIINCLKPYMNVSVIGETTEGKNVGSITIYDVDPNGIVNTRTGQKVNASHKWAMQPIVLRLYNKLGLSDYSNGISPNFPVIEREYLISGLTPLGIKTEPLLEKALQNITGSYILKSATVRSNIHFKPFSDSNGLKPHGREMYY